MNTFNVGSETGTGIGGIKKSQVDSKQTHLLYELRQNLIILSTEIQTIVSKHTLLKRTCNRIYGIGQINFDNCF